MPSCILVQVLDTTQFTSTTRQRRNTTNNRVMRVILRSSQVQRLQALGENVHDLGSNLANIGVLGASVSIVYLKLSYVLEVDNLPVNQQCTIQHPTTPDAL